MADVTGRIGDNEVELDNAATEATLKALLLATAGSVKEMKKLAKLAEKAGMDSRAVAQAEQAVKGLGAESSAAMGILGRVNPALGALGKGATFLGGVVGDLAASAFKTVGNLTNLAGSLMDGQGAASDLAGAFKDLPLGIGLVASAFQKLLQLQEAELESYRQLTKSGVNFGGALTEIRLNALELGMTLDQFAGVLTTNSQALALMGANANEGAKNFTKLAKDLRNSTLGAELRALGLTAEDTANGLANYIKMTGGRSAEEMRNTKGLSEAAGQYMKQLDMLATITGKSREEQEKALQEAQQNAAFEAYLQTLDEEGRKKAMAGMAQALAVGGKGAVQSLQARLMGLPDMTEASQTFRGTMQNAARGVDQIADAIKDGGKSITDVERAGAAAMFGSTKDLKQFGTGLVSAMSMMGGPQAEAMMTAQANLNRALKQGLVTQEDYEKQMVKVKEEQKRLQTEASAAAESEKAMRDMGAEVYKALVPIIKELTAYVNELIPKFGDLTKNLAEDLKPAIKGIIDWIKELINPATRDKAIDDLTNKIGEILGKVFSKIWDNFSFFGSSNENRNIGNPMGDGGLEVTAPAAANGAILSGPKSGFDAILHGTEAVVPLPDGRKIPVQLDMSMPSAMKFDRPDTASLVAELQKMTKTQVTPLEALQQSIEEFFNPTDKETPVDDTGKILVTELQTLNKQTAEMLAYVRDSAESNRRSIDALRGLSGNLYPV